MSLPLSSSEMRHCRGSRTAEGTSTTAALLTTLWQWRQAARFAGMMVACGFGFPLRCRRDSGRHDLGISPRNGLRKGRHCMSGDVTEVLAGFAASLQYDDLPQKVRDHCK